MQEVTISYTTFHSTYIFFNLQEMKGDIRWFGISVGICWILDRINSILFISTYITLHLPTPIQIYFSLP